MADILSKLSNIPNSLSINSGMWKALVCGSSTFNQEVDEPCSPSTPKRSPRCRRNKNNKNPYAAQGLDKFAIVVAELDERRQKIYKQMGPRNKDSLVRFRYSNSKGWVPIVIKLKEHKQDENEACESKACSEPEVLDNLYTKKSPRKDVKNQKTFMHGRTGLSRWRRHEYYLPIAIILILSCLALYGRSFAILCTSMWWYSLSKVKHKYLNSSGLMKKKEYLRRLRGEIMDSKDITSPKRKALQHGLSPK